MSLLKKILSAEQSEITPARGKAPFAARGAARGSRPGEQVGRWIQGILW